jgi:DNA repair protein RecO (recombination protein O)
MVALNCEAVLLRSVDFGESDRIVHLLTARAGRLTAIAKGARRSRRRFPGTLDIFNHLAISGRTKPRASMAFLEGARLLNPFLGLRSDPSRYALASFLTEMLDRLSPEGIVGSEAEGLFRYATESLALLETVRPTATLRLLLELRGFDALGLRPELGRCVRCGRVPSERVTSDHRVNFHVPDGGIVCSACAPLLDSLVPLEFGTLELLARGLASPAESLALIVMGADALAQAARLVFRFQRYHVGIELRSERFLEEILPIGASTAA